jgi:hypothetical protein
MTRSFKNSRSLRTSILAFGLTALGSAALAQENNMGWIGDILDNRCTPESQQGISDVVRAKIESSVARSDAVIQAPTPVGDLGCLDGIMEQTSNFFSESGLNADMVKAVFAELNVGDQVCNFAQSKWEEVSQPLTGRLGDLEIPGFNANFDASNVPSTITALQNAVNSGTQTSGGTNGSTGSGGTTGGSTNGTSGSSTDTSTSSGNSIWDLIGQPSQP